MFFNVRNTYFHTSKKMEITNTLNYAFQMDLNRCANKLKAYSHELLICINDLVSFEDRKLNKYKIVTVQRDVYLLALIETELLSL